MGKVVLKEESMKLNWNFMGEGGGCKTEHLWGSIFSGITNA